MSAPETVVDLGRFRDAFARRRGLVLRITAVTTAIGILAAVLLPPWYRSTTSLLPPSEDDAGFGLSSLLKGIGIPGVKVPSQAQPADIFLAELQSRHINEQIVRTFGLQQRYHCKRMEDALKELKRHASFTVSDAGMIAISVEDHDAKRAAAMAAAYVDALDRFNRDVRMTKGRRTREFLEVRLAQSRQELRVAEDKVSAYMAKHKALTLSPEASAAAEVGGRLFAQRTALQIQLGIAQQYSRGGSDEIMQTQRQMDEIDRQLTTLPITGVESVRLLRDVRMLETLTLMLTGQYEQARIDEVHDVPTVQVLDAPAVAERRARPKRALVVGACMLVGLLAGLAVVVRDLRPAGDARA